MVKIIPFNKPKQQPRQKCQSRDSNIYITKDGSPFTNPKYKEAVKSILEDAKKLGW
ncbi:hypothetical protein H0A36_29805 [Endozoicomonas sp. SM1973]|uniref:Uncharacterized protein n=1 Tax=Spartinivicinus marinus TaxID=2994442 RepID=A0A853IB62_9GAMM|nr:hypothetical protein [Spartinivicinus marinus]MCX4025127.1 hypothetical protein [Spartinivicinus marinus]MCX4026971.1 hypothetical protein [Spartinivicinus marinus]MCX4027915.1 hypothetical protein [Spartinivicinus marinus]NYZ70209.1 hypothetical protein [Spartinivicinus marinus]